MDMNKLSLYSKTMAITKKDVSALGLHLVPGAGDGVLTYSDGIADTEYEHIDPSVEMGDLQSNINRELRNAVTSEIEWHEED